MEILFSKGRCDVDDSGSVFGAYEIGIQNLKKLIFEFGFDIRFRDVVEERLVVESLQVFPFESTNEEVVFSIFVVFFEEVSSEDVVFFAVEVVDHTVLDVSSGGEEHVAWEGSWGGGPGEEEDFRRFLLYRPPSGFASLPLPVACTGRGGRGNRSRRLVGGYFLRDLVDVGVNIVELLHDFFFVVYDISFDNNLESKLVF